MKSARSNRKFQHYEETKITSKAVPVDVAAGNDGVKARLDETSHLGKMPIVLRANKPDDDDEATAEEKDEAAAAALANAPGRGVPSG